MESQSGIINDKYNIGRRGEVYVASHVPEQTQQNRRHRPSYISPKSLAHKPLLHNILPVLQKPGKKSPPTNRKYGTSTVIFMLLFRN
jgi:hypothetical protein